MAPIIGRGEQVPLLPPLASPCVPSPADYQLPNPFHSPASLLSSPTSLWPLLLPPAFPSLPFIPLASPLPPLHSPSSAPPAYLPAFPHLSHLPGTRLLKKPMPFFFLPPSLSPASHQATKGAHALLLSPCCPLPASHQAPKKAHALLLPPPAAPCLPVTRFLNKALPPPASPCLPTPHLRATMFLNRPMPGSDAALLLGTPTPPSPVYFPHFPVPR